MRTKVCVKAVILAGVCAFAVLALAEDSNPGELVSSIVGSTPNTTVGGIVSGGVPWTVRAGRAVVVAGNRINVQVHGLLIVAGPSVPADLVGTTGPVQAVAASLVCGGSGGAVVATTGVVTLTASGDAEIENNFTLSSQCIAPAVLIRIFRAAAPPGSQLGPFIALTGF